MSARNWNPAQLLAMKPLGTTTLVSAAAGSGKTATLTERIIRRLTDPQNPAELSRMLIITFTRAATAELKERISAALSEAIAADPGNRHLQNQLIGLGGAHISTIDSFFYEPAKAHFAELGFSAPFRIADDAEMLPLTQRVMEELVDEYYRSYAKDTAEGPFALLQGNDFADLCDSLTGSKNDEKLIDTLLDLYQNVMSYPMGLARLEQEAARLREQADEDFLLSDQGTVLVTYLEEMCASYLPFYHMALNEFANDAKAVKYYSDPFTKDQATLLSIRDAVAARRYDLLRAVVEGYQSNTPALGRYMKAPEHIVAIKDRRTRCKDQIKDTLWKYLQYTPDEVAEQMRRTARMCEVLHALLTEYDHRITAEKRARCICTFDDNRRNVLKLLRDKDGNPTDMVKEYLNSFDEVYIDEYQDVDEMQDTIFSMVGGNHRFMVGDIKQSIYGFRGADPSVFALYRRQCTQLDPQQPDNIPAGLPNGASIFMSDNYRCDESVIRVTNAICSHMFAACPDTIGYQPEDDLGFAKNPPFDGYVAPRVEVSILRKENKKDKEERELDEDTVEAANAELEAAHVANCIATLFREGAKKADGTPIRPSDIAILARTKSHLSKYLMAMEKVGVPTGCTELERKQAGKDLLHGADMMYLVNLLRVIDNPDGDIPLSEILRAPFPGMTLEELAILRETSSDIGSLYASLEAYADREDQDADTVLKDKARDFRDWLENYRHLSTTLPIDAMLRRLRRDKNCAGRTSKAFTYLYDTARTAHFSSFAGVYTFLRFFEKKLETTKNAPPVGDAADRVKLMSIHNSKGLEFPVCFVVQCGKTFSTQSIKGDLLFDKTTGVSLKLYHRDERAKKNTLLRRITALSITRTEREEEMRLLYVAMTRARERLYLCGCVSQKADPRFDAGDRFETLACNSYLSWIMAGLEAHPRVQPFYTVTDMLIGDVSQQEALTPIQLSPAVTAEESETAAHYRRIIQSLTPPTPLEKAVRSVPTKVPASRMTENLLDLCVFYPTDQPVGEEDKIPTSEQNVGGIDPRTVESIKESVRLMSMGSSKDEFELLLRANARPTAAEKGTAAHMFFQYCDYGRVVKDGLENEIARLGEDGFLTARVMEILDRKRLQAFFDSKFFAHISKAAKIERELKFARLVPLRTLTQNPALSEALGDRTLLVQGSIDLLCEFPDGHIELCDYKTDHITKEERNDPALLRARMTEKHGHQLAQYAAAIEEMYGKKPTKVYIYSVPLGEAVEIGI